LASMLTLNEALHGRSLRRNPEKS